MNENIKLDIKKRPRRLRKSNSILSLCEETRVLPSDLILPVFLKEGKSGAEEIDSMPNVYRHTVDSLLKLCDKISRKGITAIAPFPLVERSKKSLYADEALNPKSLANRAIAAVKKRFLLIQSKLQETIFCLTDIRGTNPSCPRSSGT